MRIGYCVEGSTDRAVVTGLRDRWCADAELVEGDFRGTTGIALRREIPSICKQLANKAADIIVFLTDSNSLDITEINQKFRQQAELIPELFKPIVLSGVCARNVECW